VSGARTLVADRGIGAHDVHSSSGKLGQTRNPRDESTNRHIETVAWFVIGGGFLARLFAAHGTYFNPDEALHYQLIHQQTLALAYRHGMTNAHPPLLYIVLYFWQFLGRSEWMMRMPLVIAGTTFCWFFFQWIKAMWGKTPALIGVIIAAFCPALIGLSAEVRHYSLMLVAMAAALYFLERAFQESSGLWMAGFATALYMAILSHYSAVFFTCAVGLYCLMRITDLKRQRRMYAWVISQVGALAIYAFLYITHVSKVRDSITDWSQPFYGAYFHAQNSELTDFTITQTSKIFAYLFEESHVSQLMLFAFLAGIALLFARGLVRPRQDSLRYSALLLLLSVALVWGAGVCGIYPYLGSRHTIVIAPFVIAGASFCLANLVGHRLWIGIAAAVVLMSASNLFGGPPQPYIAREDQRMEVMTAAMQTIRQVSSGDPIFTDAEGGLDLLYYLCGRDNIVAWDEMSHPGFASLVCGGHQIVRTDYHVWKFTPGNFSKQFASMAREFGLKPGDQVWTFQTGWGANLEATLPQFYPQFLCIAPKRFGLDISIIPFVVDPKLSPSVSTAQCK
jgi:MFS family permease